MPESPYRENVYHHGNIQDKVFLVTGGAGFIGSHISEYLVAHKAAKIRILDNFSTGKPGNIEHLLSAPNVELMEGDIRDFDTCLKACKDVDLVCHQAALGSVPRSLNDPITSNAANVNGTLNMFYAVKELGIERIVFASSSSIYGDNETLPKEEQNTGNALSPYALTKQVNEMYARVFSQVYPFKYIGLRYFNVFGPRQNPNGPYAAVIPLFIRSFIEKSDPIIHGDGTQSRDFTYIANAVQANMRALTAANPEALNQVYNVALGETTSLLSLIEQLSELTGYRPKPVFNPERSGDVKNSLASIQKAKALIAYHPEVNVKTGLAQTLAWYEEHTSAYAI